MAILHPDRHKVEHSDKLRKFLTDMDQDNVISEHEELMLFGRTYTSDEKKKVEMEERSQSASSHYRPSTSPVSSPHRSREESLEYRPEEPGYTPRARLSSSGSSQAAEGEQ